MSTFEGLGHYPHNIQDPPRGWAIASVGDVCESIQPGFASGRHNPEGRGIAHLRPMNIDRLGQLNLAEVKYVSEDAGDLRLQSGDVLFNNTNSPVLIGKTCVMPLGADFAFSNHMTRLRLRPGLAPSFVSHQLHHLWMSGYFLHRCVKHVNQASVASQVLASTVPLLVAPTPEQHRIAAVLDDYFSRLDAATAALERARRNLERYRASVLHAAVTGRLVPTEAELARVEGREYEPASELLARILKERRRRWEDAALAKMTAKGKPPTDNRWKARYVEPVGPDVEGLGELPEGWCWARAEQLCDVITKGTTPAATKMRQESGEIPYIKVYNLTDRGTLNFDYKPTYISNETHTLDLMRSRVLPGDVLMNIVGPPLGKVSIVPSTHPEWNINQAIAVFRTMPSMNSRYFANCLMTSLILDWAVHRAKATAGQFNLTLEICRDLPIPVPPLHEQCLITNAIDRSLSLGERVIGTLSENATRCSRLRQSILRWAFEGRLVDQEPGDEPAAVLLERIRAERVAAGGAGKRRVIRGRRGDRQEKLL